MRVYELIQELAQYSADTEVVFHVEAKLDLDVEAEFDRSDEDDTQDVTVEAKISDDFEFEDITDNGYNRNVTINLTY